MASRAGIPNKRTSKAADLFSPHVASAIQTLKEIEARKEAKVTKIKIGDKEESIISYPAKDTDRISAAKIILEYGLGKPAQPIVGGGEDEEPISIRHEYVNSEKNNK